MKTKNFGKKGSVIKKLYATSWDGSEKICITYSENPDTKMKNKITDFLLNELYDHDALDEFMKNEE